MSEQNELLLLRALLRATDYGVLLSNDKRQDILCNPRFSELFGLDETILHRSPQDVRALVLPQVKDPKEFEDTLNAAYADPLLSREDEVEFLRPRPRLYRRYTAPVLDDTGRVIGRLWTFLDITRTRTLENKVKAQAAQLKVQARQLAIALKTVSGRLNKVENVLTQTQQQLFESEKLSAVGLLAASVAHDIRNILTPLSIEVALADHNDPTTRAESLTLMRHQIDRLDLLTHRLLALAKPETYERIPVDVGALLERIAELLTPQAALENVTLQIQTAHRLPRIQADASQIDQVLINLALNGVQAMRATNGGTLSLYAERHKEGVRVRITDEGPGISPLVRRHLFDPFFSTKPDGAGLGLFSCRRIVQAHGGTIRVRSDAGRGTQFILWLPPSGTPETESISGEENHGG